MRKPTLNFLDKAINYFSPEAGVKRAYNRELIELSYDAANPDRSRKIVTNPFSEASSENARTARDRIKLMWEARNLVKNYSFIKSILMKESLYVCSRIRYQAQTGDQEIDSAYEAYWKEWEQNCDLTGRHVFRQMIQLGHQGMRCDGQHGWVIVPQGSEIKLQAIEGDRIGNPISQPSAVSDFDFNGIKINSLGQIVSFEIWNRSKDGQYKEPRELPPESFIHYLDPMRSDQYHGVTAFDTAIPHARNIYDLYKYETLAVKWASAHTGVVTKDKKDGTDWKTYPEDEKTALGTPLEKIEPGTLLRLRPGESVSPFQTAMRPSPTFTGFIETLVREMAHGLNLPYSFVWDMAALSGASARIELAMAQRTFGRSQAILEERVLNPIKNAVFSRAIGSGLLPPIDTWKNCKWQFPAYITADEGSHVQSDVMLMQQGLKTGHDIVQSMGGDYEEVLETLSREAMMNLGSAESVGIPMEVISQRYPGATEMIAMMRQQLLQAQIEENENTPVGKGEGENPAKDAEKE